MAKLSAGEVVVQMRRDKLLRQEVLKVLLEDTAMVKQLAQELMSVPAKSVGLCVPGTLTEFFNSKRFTNAGQR